MTVYRPFRLAYWMFGVWLLMSVVFWAAAERGVMIPTDRKILKAGPPASCSQEKSFNWTKCGQLQSEYSVFNPFLYSLDLIVPIVGLQQSKDWTPMIVEKCGETRIVGFCSSTATKSSDSATKTRALAYSPFGVLAAVLARLENLFGWLAGLMFVAVASGFVKKD